MSDQELLVIKLTGKAFDNPEVLSKHINVLKNLLEKYRIVLVAGGGGNARKYIELASRIGVNSNYWLDLIGIWASRVNGLVLISALSNYAYPFTPVTIEEVLRAVKYSRLVVMGGLIPGQSTASTLLEVAEALSARRVYYYSAVGRVYDKDPAKYSDAKPFSIIKASELKTLLVQKILPGEYALIDEKALDLAIRSRIKIQLLDYREPSQIYSALRGENPGTLIVPE